MDGADLAGTSLDGADLTGATGVEAASEAAAISLGRPRGSGACG